MKLDHPAEDIRRYDSGVFSVFRSTTVSNFRND